MKPLISKTGILLLVLALAVPGLSRACDICGCGVGSNYIGILPEFKKHIAGLRYRYNAIQTHLGAGGSTTYLTTREHYRTLEAWGGWNVTKRFRLMLTLPYGFNEKANTAGRAQKQGLGDISVNGYYQVLNRKSVLAKKYLVVQSLWFGGGVKLATGKYDPADKSNTNQSINLFQLGTGSNDFSLAMMYDLRVQDAGINFSGGYKLTTDNKYGYRYGNKLNFSSQLYYKFRLKDKFVIAPNAGLQFESAAADRENHFDIPVSGGNIMLGTIGAEFGFRKIVFGANFQPVIVQDLAKGTVHSQQRMMAHVAVTL